MAYVISLLGDSYEIRSLFGVLGVVMCERIVTICTADRGKMSKNLKKNGDFKYNESNILQYNVQKFRKLKNDFICV